MRHIARAASTRRFGGAALGALAVVAAVTACDLKVAQPDVASSSSVNQAAARATLLAGAISLFSQGYMGNGDSSGVASLGGLLADEFANSDYQDRHIDVDQRNAPETSTAVAGAYTELQRARVASLDVAARYAAAEPSSIHGAEAEMIAGYSFLTFAENWCNGVPYSNYNGGNIQYGTPTTSIQSYDSALVHFDKAAAIANKGDTTASRADVSDVKNAIAVGRGRTLLGLGQYAAAATAVASVPTDFVYDLYASSASSKQYNGVYSWNNNYGRFTAANNEAGVGLNFLTANDPRIAFEDTHDVGLDGRTDLIYQMRFPDYSSPMPLASGVEAQLIIAEAELQAGNSNWLTRLNDLRATVGLAALTDPSTGAGPTKARVALLFRERAFWLWMTGHRMADLRRELRQYGSLFTEAELYPTGVYPKGGSYGTDIVFKVPFDERNNPNYSGAATTCTDFNP